MFANPIPLGLDNSCCCTRSGSRYSGVLVIASLSVPGDGDLLVAEGTGDVPIFRPMMRGDDLAKRKHTLAGTKILGPTLILATFRFVLVSRVGLTRVQHRASSIEHKVSLALGFVGHAGDRVSIGSRAAGQQGSTVDGLISGDERLPMGIQAKHHHQIDRSDQSGVEAQQAKKNV